MQETKHTPGPWEKWKGGQTVFAGPLITNTTGSASGYRGEICRMDDEDFTPAQRAANAKVIAAAPQLLDVLIKTRESMFVYAIADAARWTPIYEKQHEHATAIVKDIDAAIAKATKG